MSNITIPEGRVLEGFPVRPLRIFIWVQEFGQPNRSEGGIYFGEASMVATTSNTKLGEESFAAYRVSEWRYGRVVAVGPGYVHKGKFVPLTEPDPGDIVMFSRRHGTRMSMKHDGLWIRVLDPLQIVGVCEDFEPWWDVEECQRSPEGMMTG